MRKLYKVVFTKEAVCDARTKGEFTISEGVEYIFADRAVEEIEKLSGFFGLPMLASKNDVEVRVWDKKTSLNGKKCLFISVGGGAGDALSHTALIAHAKRLYPQSEWHVAANPGAAEEIWRSNPNLYGLTARNGVIPIELWNTFDYHFAPFGLIAYNRDKEQPNFYDSLSEWMFGTELHKKRPEIYIMPQEEREVWSYLYPQVQWKGIYPSGHIVIQLNASKDVRNIPVKTWIDTIHSLQSQYPDKIIHIYGDGAYAGRFLDSFVREGWYAVEYHKQMLSPFFLNVHIPVPDVPIRLKYRGDLGGMGEARQLQNNQLSIKGAAVVVRSASLVIAVDSVFPHIAGANGIQTPCISLFGSFNPAWRVTTYPKNVSIYKPEHCKLAPCSWHEQGKPEGCPMDDYCLPLAAITADDIMEQVRKILT